MTTDLDRLISQLEQQHLALQKEIKELRGDYQQLEEQLQTKRQEYQQALSSMAPHEDLSLLIARGKQLRVWYTETRHELEEKIGTYRKITKELQEAQHLKNLHLAHNITTYTGT